MSIAHESPPIEHPEPAAEGPATYPLLGHLPHIKRDTLGFFVKAAAEYGDIVPIHMGVERVLMVNNPDYIKHILQDNFRNYRKSKFYQKIKPILGDGIFISEGERWLGQRRTLQPAFHGPDLQAMGDEMVSAAAEMVARWRPSHDQGRALEVSEEMMRLTLDVVLRTLLNVRLGGDEDVIFANLRVVLREAENRVWAMTPIREHVPTRANREFKRALAALNSVVYTLIEKRRHDPEPPQDLLSMLLAAYDDPERREASNRELRDLVMSVILAGHETTANALTWSWYLLSKNPTVGRRVRQEVATVLGGRAPTIHDLKDLKYTQMVFEEAMRLYPPVWTFSRTALGDDRLGSTPIPKGTTVMLCAYAVHRNPRFWDNPEGFDPERFAPERVAARPPFAYFPFGGGPRLCIGHRFGMMEGVLVMAMVAQRYRLELVPGYTVEPEPMITLRPRNGLKMTLHEEEAIPGPLALAS
jgi:cytochrome P450